MRWLDSITESLDMNLSQLREKVEDRGAWCAAVPSDLLWHHPPVREERDRRGR